MFQGLTEQQKEIIEKQWAQQKEQFMGRQKSTYVHHFRGFEPPSGAFSMTSSRRRIIRNEYVERTSVQTC